MGRYYNGDIEGKFWFAVQSSTAADRFGVTGETPNFIDYYFAEEDLPGVEEEITNIQNSLGNRVKILDDFFEKNNGYNDKMLEEINITREELADYADLKLGIQIRDCIKDNGYCGFTAEL